MKKKKNLLPEEANIMKNDDIKETEVVAEEDSSKDFEFVSDEGRVYEQKFSSKPTTFFKDALKRFAKNKSSLVAAGILLILIGFAIVVPLANKNDIVKNNLRTKYLPPKWFDSANGFMDGTTNVNNAMLDPVTDELVDPDYKVECVVGGISASTKYTDTLTEMVAMYGAEGNFVLSAPNRDVDGGIYSPEITFDTSDTVGLSVKFDAEGMNSKNTGNGIAFKFFLTNQYNDELEEDIVIYEHDPSASYDNELNIANLNTLYLDSPIYAEAGSPTRVKSNLNILVRGSSDLADTLNVLYIKSLTFSHQSEATYVLNCDIEDGVTGVKNYRNSDLVRKYKAIADTEPNIQLYHAKVRYGSFRYDAYKAAYGEESGHTFAESEIKTFVDKGWMEYTWNHKYIKGTKKPTKSDGEEGDYYLNTVSHETYIKTNGAWEPFAGDIYAAGEFKLTEAGQKYCPIREVQAQDYYETTLNKRKVTSKSLIGTISWYRWDYFSGILSNCEMPKFFFGTDKFGRDFFKIVFSGLLISLGLGLMASAINIFIGIIWGSISGYFGGWVDIIMQRIIEILGGMPWIVMMTLIILLLGCNFWTFLLALCLTGWMGIANITREQFYRYKGREYVLASRTLGASDARLIFKHILPNGIGTIVTSSVLMIPSVIFTEANISYLLPNLLSFGNVQTFGISLSSVQADIQYYPYLIVSASIIMALLMISFNLFGNGLRDAFNPSLKGSDE